jgi:hypothetical protein
MCSEVGGTDIARHPLDEEGDLLPRCDQRMFLRGGGIAEHPPSLEFLRLVHRSQTEDGRVSVGTNMADQLTGQGNDQTACTMGHLRVGMGFAGNHYIFFPKCVVESQKPGFHSVEDCLAP